MVTKGNRKMNRKLKRRKGIVYDYNGDGQFPQERINKFWKRYWSRWLRRSLTQRGADSFPNDPISREWNTPEEDEAWANL